MTVLLSDAFNRTGANLASNPVGRWDVPAPGAGTNDWTLDGQTVRSTAVTSSVRGWARLIGTNAGTAYGEVRALLKRSTSSVAAAGLLMHCDRSTMGDRSRFGFIHNNTSSRYELRYYTDYDTFTIIAQITESAAGLTLDTQPRPWRFRVVKFGATTSTTLAMSGWISGINIFSLVTFPDVLAGADSNNRAPGFEVLQPAGSASTHYLSVDNFEFDDLDTPDAETEYALATEATLTPLTPATEGSATGTTPVTPDFGEVITERYFVNRTDTEAGYQVTWARHQDRRRLWRCVHNALTASELSTLSGFLDSHNGSATAWTYDTPEGSTAKVYFVDDTFAFTRLPSPSGNEVYRCEYAVEEIG